MSFKGVTYFLSEEEIPDTYADGNKTFALLFDCKLSTLGMEIGESIKMIYDFGCEQRFDIKLTGIEPMPKGHGRAYPKILAGEGRSIVDDMPAYELLEIIKKIDAGESSGIYYSRHGISSQYKVPEWDYRGYDLSLDNLLSRERQTSSARDTRSAETDINGSCRTARVQLSKAHPLKFGH